MSVLLARWNDFTKGDAGWLDKSKIAAGFFTGENVQVFRDGSVGPRSGLLDLAPVSLPGAGTYTPQCMGYVDMDNTGVEYVWIAAGFGASGLTNAVGRVAVFDANGKVLTGQTFHAVSGAFTQCPVDAVQYDARITLMVTQLHGVYKVDWSSGSNGTASAVGGSPNGGCIEIFGDFLCVAAPSFAQANRIMFSKASDYTTWPAGNFVDVGTAGNIGGDVPAIVAMRRVKDQLLVFCDTGQLFVITGTLGSNEVIREFMPGDAMSGPSVPSSVARTRDGGIWWTRREEMVNVIDQPDTGLPSAVPVTYNGGTRTESPTFGGHLRQSALKTNKRSQTLAVPGRIDKSCVLLDEQNRALIQRDGVWTRHEWDFLHYRAAVGSRGDLYLVDSPLANLHAWQFELERPPYYNQFGGSGVEVLPYDTSDLFFAFAPPAWMATPEFRTVSFGEVIVERIEVLFTEHHAVSRWATGPQDPPNNHFDVYLQQYDVPGAREAINAASFNRPSDKDDSGGPMSTGGVTIGCGAFDNFTDQQTDFRRRQTFYPDGASPLPAPGIRVALTNMVGVSIHEVVVFGTNVTKQP